MEADFKSASLRFATFTSTNLKGSDLNSVILDNAGLAGCNLGGIKNYTSMQLNEAVLIEPEDSPVPAPHQIKDLMSRVLTGHEHSVWSVAISDGAGIIASGSSDKTIKLWEIKRGKEKASHTSPS